MAIKFSLKDDIGFLSGRDLPDDLAEVLRDVVDSVVVLLYTMFFYTVL